MRAAARVLIVALLLFATLAPLPSAGAERPELHGPCLATVGKDVVVVFDRSSSMLDDGKFPAAKAAANAFLDTLSPALDQSALVSFASGFSLDKGLDMAHSLADHPTLSTEAKVNGLVASGATNLGGAVRLARYELDNGLPSPAPGAPYSGNARTGVPRIMVVLSDGDQTVNQASPVGEANYAKTARNITIYSVALGTAISPAGLSAMENMSSGAGHFFVSPSIAELPDIFGEISDKLNDANGPGITLVKPSPALLYDNDVVLGASPIAGEPVAQGIFTLTATATDDCRVDRVEFFLDGAFVGSDLVGPDYTSPVDCDALPAGRHEVRAVAYDWLDRSAETSGAFWCLGAFVDAHATSLYTRLTNPVDPQVRTLGASLSTSYAPTTHDVVRERATSPVAFDLGVLHDETNGSIRAPEDHYARALSRLADITLPTLGQRLDILETSASAWVDANAASLAKGTTTTSRNGENALVDIASFCIADVATTHGSVTHCGERVTLANGVTLILNEQITTTGPLWREVTINGLHILVEQPEARYELILSQSYAGASAVGPSVLRGPARSLDLESDAGSGADAPPGPLASNAFAVEPGTYGARIASTSDIDAYSIAAVPGEKVHVAIAASDATRTSIGSFSPLPTSAAAVPTYATSLPARAPTTATLPGFSIALLDPNGTTRDAKLVTSGAANAVELNVDMPGDWVVVVRAAGAVGDYTMQVTRTLAPMTESNDALLGVDAAATCADASLVGPGAHVGTLEDGDLSDWYRFRLEEGQVLALTLRPGDTLEAADMQLRFYDRACQLIASGTPVLGTLVKGSPELVTFNVPTAASGIYRAEVSYVNGIGTYELIVATSVAGTP